MLLSSGYALDLQKLLESMRKHRGQSQAQAESQSQAQAEGQSQAQAWRAVWISAQKVIIDDESELAAKLLES